MMVAWAMMFLCNGYSMLKEDLNFAKIRSTHRNPQFVGTKSLQKRLWWRDERSHKSWKLFDQMQFLSAYGIINAVFTTQLYNFLGFWNWANFLIPLSGTFYWEDFHPPRSINYTISFPFPTLPTNWWTAGISTVPTGRKRDWEQFANASETDPVLLLATVCIWFAIILAAALILYGVYYLVITLVLCTGDDKKGYPEILSLRFKHITFRVLHAAYFPMVFMSAFSIQHEQTGIIALAIVVGILLITFGLPLFNWYLTQQPLHTEWFNPKLRIPFGSFYASFNDKSVKFQFWTYMKKTAVGGVLGGAALGATSGTGVFWAQIIIALVALSLYSIVLMFFKPYIDVAHLVLDMFIHLLNVVALGLAFLAIQTDASSQSVVQWIILILQIPIILFVVFAYLWSSMFYMGYTSPRQILCCEPKPVEEDDTPLDQPMEDEQVQPDRISASDSELLAVISLPPEDSN
eukprot:TRINITY_DN9605_c0_g1_i4.p1 TRINITY_DN9605_c0_g1~~TRINITY_DN9605_c0_g1_i4.p1  ORF type:complete len:461 (+),score=74.31 TRINITY_DN9605_c0_g1_i4:1039-2421(+)